MTTPRVVTCWNVYCDESLGAELHLLYEGAVVLHTAGGRHDAVPIARAAAARLVG